jgi:hypothetical protein
MRYVRIFAAAIAVTLAAAAVVETATPADLTSSAVCNDKTRECVLITWSDGSQSL